MAFTDWFNKLSDDNKLWLVQNMGSPLPVDVQAAIVAAGGPSELSDDDNAWIERVNNGEDIL